jgi:hypothetical protein
VKKIIVILSGKEIGCPKGNPYRVAAGFSVWIEFPAEGLAPIVPTSPAGLSSNFRALACCRPENFA